jgi:L-threonylcarbamoyladenylate synthase
MSELVSVRIDGAAAARSALERCVSSGGVAVFPSDGLYGLACDPLDEAAIERIHKIKGRDDGKPSAVLYFSPLAMRELLDGLGPRTAEVAGALLPGPVTLIVPNPDGRYPLACRDDSERLGVRLIDGPLAGAMCPVFQTSANLSGEPAPSVFDEIPSTTIVDAVDLAIDGGALTGLPSTVVDVTEIEEGGEWHVLREGGMSIGDLTAALELRPPG